MLSFFPRDVLVGILDLVESVSEGFSTYSRLSHDLWFFLLFFLQFPSSYYILFEMVIQMFEMLHVPS